MTFSEQYGPWALVTGASAGLGAEFARALAKRGVHSVLVARRAERLEALARELKNQYETDALVVAEDLVQDGACARVASRCSDVDLGLIVNNAGFGWSGSFIEEDPEQIQNMVRLNCEVPAVLARHLLPRIVSRGRGGMVVVSSVAGYQPTPWMSVYGATKAFDLLWGEAVGVELAAKGVDVIVVSPGHTKTEFHEVAGVKGSVAGASALPEAVVEEALSRLGRSPSFVHGWSNKAVALAAAVVPRPLISRVAGRMLKKRLPPDSE